MQTTTLKLVVSAPDSPMAVPDTGQFTTSVGEPGGAVNILNSAAIISLLVILAIAIMIVAYIRHKKKSNLGFSIVSKKSTMAFRLFLFLMIGVALGGAGKILSSESGKVEAANNGVEFAATNVITIETQLDDEESVAACGNGSVVVNQALPAGYKLNMSAGELKLNDSESVVIPSTEETGLTEGSWGYVVGSDNKTDLMKPVPESSAVISDINEATGSQNATELTFCVMLPPDTEVGVYESEITYFVSPYTVQYSLNYDANGGTFETAPEAQVSGETFENSHEFTITDIIPVAPEGSALNFYGWSITGDSLSDIYSVGETIEVDQIETTLKAVWGYNKYTISYNKNTEEEIQNFVPTQYCIIVEEGNSSCNVRITSRVPAASGYTLLGWSREAYTPGEDTTIDEARAKVEFKPGDETTLSGDLTLYAVWWKVSNNDYQIELRWGELPNDLDSHLVAVRNSDREVIFEVDFTNKEAQIENGTITLSANLDIDDTSSYGPETLTLNMLPASAYSDYTFYYYIENFSGEDKGVIKNSGANITLIRSNGDTSEYNVSTASGASASYWNVFAIKNGQIIDRNTLTGAPELEY